MKENKDFLRRLRTEIADTQQRRAAFVRGKLAFVVGLLGAGAINIDGLFEATTLLYFVPLVAFVFDLYILGEDFSIKRIAVFIRTSPAAPSEEKLWEKGVDQKRDWFSYWAAPLSSSVVLIAATVGIKASSAKILPFLPWLIVNLLFIILLIAYRPIRIRSLTKFEELLTKEDRCSDCDS